MPGTNYFGLGYFGQYFPVTAAGPAAINATADQTIDAVTQSVNADLLVQATASQTIDAVTQSADADLLVQATAAQTIDAVTQDAAATITGEGAAAPTQGGGWLSESQVRAHERWRKKKHDEERELEETIRLAYQRLTGKLSAAPIIAAAQGEPEKLAVQAVKLAEKLVTKSNNSARMHARNAAIIADLKRQAQAILDQQIEEEAIVMLLAA